MTVDLVATGTDIKPSRDRDVHAHGQEPGPVRADEGAWRARSSDKNDLKGSEPGRASAKTHFVIVDCVGMTESELSDTQPLERKQTIAFKKLLEHVAMGGTDPAFLSSLASRLSRLAKQCGEEDHEQVENASGGVSLQQMSRGIVEALDPDNQVRVARATFELEPDQQPTDEQLQQTSITLVREATSILATKPQLRATLQDLKRQLEQLIDDVSIDQLIEAGASQQARERARSMVTSFEQFLEDNKDEIDALQFFYSQPYGRRLRFEDIKQLADAIKAPPRSWTPEQLWRAYETLEQSKVRGASAQRLLTDLVSLVRFATREEDELVPYADQVRERFGAWLQQQLSTGREFTEEQVRWLEMMRDHVATSLEMTVDDLDYAPFAEEGGLGRAAQVFGGGGALRGLLDELNEVLAA